MAEFTELEISRRIATMKVGFAGGFYPLPPGVPEADGMLWRLNHTADMGGSVYPMYPFPKTAEDRAAFKARADELGISLEGPVMGLFPELGEDPASNVAAVRAELEKAKEMGVKVVRGAYGRLRVAYSRWAGNGANRKVEADRRKAHLVGCLKSAAPLAEEAGVRIAIENHCDFFGYEWAEMFAEIDSPWIGAALDTANGFSVGYDANDDVEALAEWAFTTHIKDMRMIQHPLKWAIPFLPVGCRLGEGHVDIPRALRLLAERSPAAVGLHLIVEPGWEPEGSIPEAELPPGEMRHQILDHGVEYLNNYVAEHRAQV
ncbi:MAG: sugar phosphate isomerase/epimerase [Propionibacteriaceae bacterium]|jgi:sugar phosphate isomerase/epimerase|nr:sugar phosphate isomerase/epimerase [Propionibacteriaceae bacterium]